MKIIKKLPRKSTCYLGYLEDQLQETIDDILICDAETLDFCDTISPKEYSACLLLSKEDKKELKRFLLMYANRIKQRIVEKTKGIKR